MPASTNKRLPLVGIKILDLTRLLPGPLATLFLADMGAEVIKVEDPVIGDYAKKLNLQGFYQLNRNKSSKILDLKQEEDKQAFKELCRTSDVLIESFRPGVMKSLGLDYQNIKTLNPKIVYLSLTGYGQSGPYKDKAGHDINYLGYSGLLDQMGPAGSAPSLINFQIADIAGGSLMACTRILASLLDSQRSGRGSYIDCSILDGILSLSPLLLAAYQTTHQVPTRGAELLSGGTPCYQVYQTKDQRFMALGALEKKFWELFCRTIQRIDLIPGYLSSGHKGNELFEILSSIFQTKTQSEWIQIFKHVDCCCTPVLTIEETLKNEHVLARSVLMEAPHPVSRKMTCFVLPLVND